jgi:hypothetical protein
LDSNQSVKKGFSSLQSKDKRRAPSPKEQYRAAFLFKSRVLIQTFGVLAKQRLFSGRGGRLCIAFTDFLGNFHEFLAICCHIK